MRPDLDSIMVRSRSSERQIVVGTSPVQIADRVQSRCSLTVAVPAGQLVTISLNPNVTSTNGINIPVLGGSVTFSLPIDGAVVYGPWYAVTDSNTSTITVLESNSDAD